MKAYNSFSYTILCVALLFLSSFSSCQALGLTQML